MIPALLALMVTVMHTPSLGEPESQIGPLGEPESQIGGFGCCSPIESLSCSGR